MSNVLEEIVSFMFDVKSHLTILFNSTHSLIVLEHQSKSKFTRRGKRFKS